jgi:hypothetical protein
MSSVTQCGFPRVALQIAECISLGIEFRLIFSLMYVSMLSRFGRRFEQAAAAARLNWRKSSVKVGDLVPAAASPP